MRRSSARYIRPAILFAVAFGLIFSAFFHYSVRISDSLYRETRKDLIERADQTAKTLQLKLDDSFAYLESIAGVVASYDDLKSPEVLTYLTQQDSNSLFENFLVSAPDGNAVSGKGETYSLKDSKTFESSLKGINTVSDPRESLVNGKRGVELSVPILRGREIVGVLQCDYRIEQLKELFDGQFFEGKGRVNVITANGIMVTNTEELSQFPTYFEALREVQLQGGMTVETFQADLMGGKSGILEFIFQEKKRYVVYSPVGRNSWYTLASVPANVVDTQAGSLARYGALLVGEVMLILLALVIYFAVIQQRNKRRIQKSEQELSSLISNIPGGVCKYRLDEWMTIVSASPGLCALTGYSAEQMPGQLSALIGPDDLADVRAQLEKQLEHANAYVWEHHMTHANGSVLWILQKGQMLVEDGQKFLYSVFVDITVQKNIRQQLEISEQRYRAILERSDSILFDLNLETGKAVFSDVWEKKFGYPPVEENFLEAIVCRQIVHPDDVHKNLLLFERASGDEKYNQEIVRLRQGKDNYIWCSVGLTSISAQDGTSARVVGVIKDVDKEQRRVRRMQAEAQRDALTGLYNKKFTQRIIEEFLKTEGINGTHAFLIIDIDHFKQINDTLGHLQGDAVISELAQRLIVPFRNSDIIGRIGGDEFVVFIKNIRSKKFAGQKAEEVNRSFHSSAAGQGYPLSCSIGIALYSVDGLAYEALYHNADLALYQAKKAGRDQVSFYTSGIEAER